MSNCSTPLMAKFEEKLSELGLKDTLQADLKVMGLHRDVLKLLRCFEQAKREINGQNAAWHTLEKDILQRYLSWINREKVCYPTTLQ